MGFWGWELIIKTYFLFSRMEKLMKNRRKIIYIAILISFIIVILFKIDMGIYDKNINKVESKQIEIFTLHNIEVASTIKLGNLTCYEGSSKDVKDIYFVSCYRKSAFYPLYRTIDIKIIQKLGNGEYNGVLLYDQTSYYSISVSGDKFTSATHEYDFIYYASMFLWTSIVYLLWFSITIYRNKKTGEKNEENS